MTAVPAATLVILDWSTLCAACGEDADPHECRHDTVLGFGPRNGQPGCRVMWTHIAAASPSRIGAEARIRDMRPDLVWLPDLVHTNELPIRAGASATAEATGSVTGRPSPSLAGTDANAGKPGPTTEEEDPRPGAGGPGGALPADRDLVWVAIRRRGVDAHRPARIDDDGATYTACDRSMRTGEQLTWDVARVAYAAHLCRLCWPHTPGGAR